jgi:hypothetical protein
MAFCSWPLLTQKKSIVSGAGVIKTLLSDAFLDRLLHRAYQIVMKDESLRRKKTAEEAAS